MMQDNTPINFYIKHFFINCQIKKLQPIFDTFVPPCMFNEKVSRPYTYSKKHDFEHLQTCLHVYDDDSD
jgi:hypothetical protein